jgi:NAD(P)-dependent dehydrogenase (short-subunit alcohol dehydrogenase family)
VAKDRDRDLRGKVVIVTGGARGIGAATARAFREAGAQVVVADIDKEALEAAESSIHPAKVAYLDVTSRASFESLFDDVEATLGPVDILVNNAGIMPMMKVTEIPDALADRVLDINLRGVILGTRVALARMLPRRCGHIINMSSTLGEFVGPGLSDYCASKFGVIGFTDSARYELKGTGVDLSLVLPGQVNTELVAGLRKAKGLGLASPESIADAIIGLARRPRRRVYSPLTFAAIAIGFKLLPRGLGEGLITALGGRTIVDSIDSAGRRAYDERIRAGIDKSQR